MISKPGKVCEADEQLGQRQITELHKRRAKELQGMEQFIPSPKKITS